MKKKNFNPSKEIDYQNKVRLVVYDNDSKTFLKREIINSSESLDILFEESINIESLKYKYQNIEEDKWKDLTKYKYLKKNKVDISKLTTNFNFSDLDKENIVYLKDLDERQMSRYTVVLLRRYYYFLLASPDSLKINRVKSYIEAMPLSLARSNDKIAYCYTLIMLITAFIENSLKSIEDFYRDRVFEDWCTEVIKKYNFEQKDVKGSKVGILVAKGHIASLHDRSITFDCYQQALDLGKGFIESFLGIDPLSTYYAEVDGPNKTYEIVDTYIQELKYNSLNLCSHINICFSTDISYFQMYATNWANANFYFKNLVFNFGIVTNSKDEYNHCVTSYQSIIKGISELLNTDLPSNFRFFWIKSTVINKTVYACARFYLARYLLNNYDENVYISDIDQLVIGDFEKYLEKFDDNKYSVYQPISSGYFSILPGRSHMAGNIYIRNDIKGKKYCEILTDYVGMGLSDEFSWILDQNATRFASEVIEVGNLDTYGPRTLKQYPNLKIKLRSLDKK